ncbi:MAG: PrsW family intramembrane metalloprotease [Chloroflexi bacterium]|nr:PrsW family intramembrane metalloprotease [Chloroflexota bacterium]
MALGIIISVFIPLVFLYIIWTLDIYALSRVPLVFGALLWGLFTFAASFSVQNALMRVGLLDFWQITLFNAPVLEQLLKATFLIWLASQMRLRSSIDGAVYGFAVGTGFAMAENLLYISGTPDRALGIALARVLSVSLMHAYTTAIIGTATGASLYMAQRAHAQRIALALLASIMLHAMFNRLVMTADGVPLISTAIAAGLGGTALVALSMQRSLVADMRFIGHELGTMMPLPANAKTLTRQQVAALVADTRGEHNPVRRALVHQYVALHAERSLLQRGLAQNQRPQFDELLVQRLAAIDQHLEDLRGQMGLYACVWLHAVLYAAHNGMWDQVRGRMAAFQPALALTIELRQRLMVQQANRTTQA